MLLLLAIGYVLTGFAQVGKEERAVVKRFGRVVAVWEPGLHFGLPWGIDRVDRIPIATVRHIRFGYAPDQADNAMPLGQLLTADQNLVNVQVAVDYSVAATDAGLIDFLTQRDTADGLIARAAESLLAEWVASHGVDDVLLMGNVLIPRWLSERLPVRIEPYRLGVHLRQVSVAYLAPPDEVKPAFDEVNRAQTNNLTLENRARQEASQRKRSAQAEANRQARMAEATVGDKVAMASAEAGAFGRRLSQFQSLRTDNPDVLAGIWWDEMGKVLVGLKARGRIDLLDSHLGADGLDITQFLPPRRR